MRRPWLERLGLQRRELRAWALYDWANSAFMTTVITAVFPIYFQRVAARDLEPNHALALFGWASTLAVALVAVLSPVLGAAADFAGAKKRYLGAFLLLGVAATAAMALIGAGQWRFAAALFVLGNVGAFGSMAFYDSLLPHVARPEEIDRVSSAGYALGYLGGGLLLTLNAAWLIAPARFGLSGPEAASRLSFLSVAVWWLVFSVPLFRRVSEPPRRIEADEVEGANPLRVAFTRLGETFRELRSYRDAFLMLAAFAVYNDGINTIIRMATSLGAQLGLATSDLILAVLLVQFVGVPCAFLFGALAGRTGPRAAILIALGVYAGISVLGFYMRTAAHFYLLALLVGTVQGGSQALSRSLFAGLVPQHKSAEFFGFFGVFEKFTGILGPLLFASTVAATGSSRLAILAIVGFFVVGAVMLSFVDVERGRRVARDAEAGLARA